MTEYLTNNQRIDLLVVRIKLWGGAEAARYVRMMTSGRWLLRSGQSVGGLTLELWEAYVDRGFVGAHRKSLSEDYF